MYWYQVYVCSSRIPPCLQCPYNGGGSRTIITLTVVMYCQKSPRKFQENLAVRRVLLIDGAAPGRCGIKGERAGVRVHSQGEQRGLGLLHLQTPRLKQLRYYRRHRPHLECDWSTVHFNDFSWSRQHLQNILIHCLLVVPWIDWLNYGRVRLQSETRKEGTATGRALSGKAFCCTLHL